MSTHERRIFTLSMDLIDQWKLQGKWQDACEFLAGLHPVARSIDSEAQAIVWLNIGRVLTDEALFGGKVNQVKRHEALKQAEILATTASNPALLGNIYDALGFSLHADYLNSDRGKEPGDEMDYFQCGLELRQEHGSPAQVAESTFHIGLVHDAIRKEYDKALPYHEKAYQIAKDENDALIASYAIRHIGFVRANADDIDGAQQAFTESLELREAIGFTPGIAFSLTTLAYIEAQDGQKSSALNKLKRARELLASLDAQPRLAWIDNQIASISEA